MGRGWDHGLYGLRSLYELLQVNAYHYVQAGEVFSKTDAMFQGGLLSNFQLPEPQMAWLKSNLPILAAHCGQLRMPVTHDMIGGFYAEFRDVPPTWNQALEALRCIRASFKSEIKTRLFMFVLPHRTPFYSDATVRGYRVGVQFERIFGKYPSTQFDVLEAGNCLCYERFTAAVYHLMRAAEYGLMSIANSLGDVPKNPSWDGILRSINEMLNRQSSSPTKPANRKSEERFDSEASAWFKDIKNGWRNFVSHTPRIYSESRADGIFAAVRNVMEHLATRTGEVTMPPTVSLPDIHYET
jgi:hypothetical protein